MTWQHDLEAAWKSLEETSPAEFLARIRGIVEAPSVPRAMRAFQLACAHDSTGRPDLAVPGYEAALAKGLDGYERRRAKIQLASSMRNLGRSAQSVEILSDEPTDLGDELDDAIVVFRSLALTDVGREREAVVALVHALADHLPRYTASAHRYADALLSDPSKEAAAR